MSTTKQKYIVQIREAGEWSDQGDGPMTELCANRVAREIRQDFHCATRVIPADQAAGLRTNKKALSL